MARGILGGLFGGGDSSVMPGLLDQAGYMDPAEYDRRRQGDAMQGLWAGLLQGSGPSLEPRNFFSALGGGLAASQKSANEFDEAQLRRAQGVAAYQKSQLERDRLRLGYDVTQQYLRDQAPGALPRPGAPPAVPDAGGGGGGNLSDPRGLVPYIRAEAARLNIDPDVAVRVAGSEGLGTFLGDGGKSGGAFQLYTGGGVGNLFQNDTGLDPLDPVNEKATITYALQHAAKNGWGDWNGAKKLGITGYTGIGKPGEARASNVADLSAVPDFAGAMMGRQGASYAPATPPPMPGAVAGGAPGPAPAPGATAAPSGAGQPTRTGGYQFYGDSVAHGTREAAGAGGVTKVGWRPDQVLGSLTGANPQGDTVVISSGITNSTAAGLPRDQWKRDIALVPQQIGAALKSGAGRVALYGVGDGVRDNGEINAALRQVAADNGAEFVPLIGTGSYTDRQGRFHAAGWHPQDYNAQNTYTRTQLGAQARSGGSTEPSPLPADAGGEIGSGGEAPAPGAVAYGAGGIAPRGFGPPAASAAIPPPAPVSAAAAAAPAPAVPTLPAGATGALVRGGGLGAAPSPAILAGSAPDMPPAPPSPGAVAPPSAAAPGSPNTMFGMPLPVLPAAPAPPQVPAIPGLVAPGAPPALAPLAPVGAAPPVQLPPEQAARTRRAQGLALGLDLMGITVPKFIADEAGIEVAARSAAAQEAAKQPFAVQMERLRGDIAQQRAEFEAKSKLQQDEYATRRGFATDQFKSALGQLDDIVKQYTAAGLAGPVAGATAREQARFKNVEATILGPDGQPTTQRMTDLEFTQRREQQAARGSTTPQPGDIVGMPAYTPGQEELSRGSSKDILTRRTMAQDAAQSIETNKEARALLDGGIFAGAGSNVETAVAKIGNALKLTGQTTKDTVANTEAYFSTVAQNVGRLIKQFGSGTGLSDADRQYAAAMAAGKQTLDEASIRKILDINDRAGTNVINAHNRSVARVPQGVSLTPLTVELPTPYEKAPATAPRERFYNPRTGTFSP